MIIDYLMQTGNMNAMQNVGKYAPDANGPLYNSTTGVWRPDICFLCQVNDYTKPSAPVPVNGVFLWVTLPNLDANLQASPACQVVADRQKAQAGDPTYLIFTTLTQAQRAVQRITPVMAGAHYPFQAH